MADDKLKAGPESPGEGSVGDAQTVTKPPVPETVEEPAAGTGPVRQPEQSVTPGMGGDVPAQPAPQVEADKVKKSPDQDKKVEPEEKTAKRRGRPPKEQDSPQGDKPEKGPEPRTGRPSKVDKAAREEAPPSVLDKVSRGKKADKGKETGSGGAPVSKSAKAVKSGKAAPVKEAAVPPPEINLPPTPDVPPRPVEEGKIVYLKMAELHPFHTFREHPYKVQDDKAMDDLVGTIKEHGIMTPATVRPEKDGKGYEIIAGHRRQMASQLAGYRNMPCIVRNMTDDEAILAMTDDNLRQRETILPSEKAMSLKMQYEAIKHQGARGDSAEAGKLSLESVGQRNGMSVKTVQRYIWLNDLVPELKQTMDDGKLSFTPAVEISRVRPKHQKYIAVSIEGQQASPSKGQAKRLRELDKENKLSPDVIDGILCEEKKKEDRDVIITGAELEKFFGKEATPRQMKDQIMTLLEDWKERQPPELAKPDKKMDMEK